MIKDMFKINIKNFNIFTAVSILSLLAGFFFWIYWGTRYGIWYDIGIYSITIVFAIAGIVGILLSLMEKEEEED
jgi:Na+/proline symporter